jgi:hypothetical protein
VTSLHSSRLRGSRSVQVPGHRVIRESAPVAEDSADGRGGRHGNGTVPCGASGRGVSLGWVLGLIERAQHPVAMHVQLATVRLGETGERRLVPRHRARHEPRDACLRTRRPPTGHHALPPERGRRRTSWTARPVRTHRAGQRGRGSAESACGGRVHASPGSTGLPHRPRCQRVTRGLPGQCAGRLGCPAAVCRGTG